MTQSDLTDDAFLRGRVVLKQSATGHRAGSDAVFLAASIPPQFTGRAVDAGSASGAVGLMAAWRAPHATFKLIDIDVRELSIAKENIAANSFGDRVTLCQADLLAPYSVRAAQGLCHHDHDLVLSNPPFLDEGQVRVSPDDNRARAHVMPEGGLEAWVLASLHMLKSDSIFTMIHRADRLDHILHLMKGRFGDLVVLPIYPRHDVAATRVLVSGVCNSRAAMRLLPALILHRDDGGFTDEAKAIHAGDQPIILR